MENAKPQLVLIDCDGVLYDPAELDINAMCYAFNDVCDDFGLQDEKFTSMEDCTYDKPVKGFCKYIEFLAQKLGIDTEDFIRNWQNIITLKLTIFYGLMIIRKF